MEFLFKTIYFYLIAFFLAILEIQIEGEHGWAEKLPTWRPHPDSKFAKIYRKLFNQKEVTGYHIALNLFILLFIHWPFVWNWGWDIWAEIEILRLYMMFVLVWDFLWFVLNPKFSLKDFGPNKVWWHMKWLGRVPTVYLFNLTAVIILSLPEIFLIDLMSGVDKILILLGVNLILTILTVIIYPKTY